MSDEQGQAGPGGGPGGRKRPGPTIDLKATEVTSDSGPDTSAGGHTGLSGGIPWPAVAAGAGGAAIVGALLLILWPVLWPLLGPESGIGALDGRLAGAEQRLRALEARPTTSGVDPKTVEELAARVQKLEAALANPRQPAADPALANRMATLEGQIRSIDEKVGIVARRTDDITTIAGDARDRAAETASALAELSQKVAQLGPQQVEHSEIDALAKRLAALETSAKQIEAELGKRVAPETADRGARLATVAAALNAAVERAEPFAPTLASAKALGADPKAIAALEPFAASGVPSAASLSGELSTLIPALTSAAGVAPREGGFLERLQANAERIIRVRRVEDVPGDDPAAVLTRIEMRASQSDVAGAVAELAKLPPPAREVAAAWIAKAQARDGALAASRKLAVDAFAALGKAP